VVRRPDDVPAERDEGEASEREGGDTEGIADDRQTRMRMTTMRPERLGDNRVPVYYAGGANIDDFRGATGPHPGPEDWVASLCALPPAILGPEHPPDTGVSRLADGSSLRDRVAGDPDSWLGRELSARFSGDPGLLVKLLDAGERLPVHCHPTRAFARHHLGSFFGKTEGWIIMRADPGAQLWLGLRDTIDRHEWTSWVTSQDAAAMLAAMNVVKAQAGQVVFVPAGLPHAIGPGVMLTELQEPTSFSVLAEHAAFGVSEDVATLGLGWDLALSCFDLRGRRDNLGELITEPTPAGSGSSLKQLFRSEAADYFGAVLVTCRRGTVALGPPCFAVLVVAAGAGEVRFDGGSEPLRHGETWVAPYGAGPLEFAGNELQVIVCLPPGAYEGSAGRCDRAAVRRRQ
jgi:mannose-6-phosphate isomerase